MKAVTNGNDCDTFFAQPLSTGCFLPHGISEEKRAYWMPESHHFIVRRINGQETP